MSGMLSIYRRHGPHLQRMDERAKISPLRLPNLGRRHNRR